MTTRVLMTSVLQKRRAQWSLQPKTAEKVEDVDLAGDPADGDRTAAEPSTAAAPVLLRAAGSSRHT